MSVVLLGLWPFVMRRVIGSWSETEYSSFGVTLVADRVVGTLNVCTSEGPANFVVFSFAYGQEWEQRVVSWAVNMLCCAVGQLAPVGLNCRLLSGLERVLVSRSGPRTVSLVSLKLTELNKRLVDASIRVMGGTDVHTILNHLQSRLKEFVQDPIFLACPKLLQVTICYFLDYFSLMLICRFFGGDAFRGCIVCNLGIFLFL